MLRRHRWTQQVSSGHRTGLRNRFRHDCRSAVPVRAPKLKPVFAFTAWLWPLWRCASVVNAAVPTPEPISVSTAGVHELVKAGSLAACSDQFSQCHGNYSMMLLIKQARRSASLLSICRTATITPADASLVRTVRSARRCAQIEFSTYPDDGARLPVPISTNACRDSVRVFNADFGIRPQRITIYADCRRSPCGRRTSESPLPVAGSVEE